MTMARAPAFRDGGPRTLDERGVHSSEESAATSHQPKTSSMPTTQIGADAATISFLS